MTHSISTNARVAIACGGTGGHLFPGMAVAEELRARGCRVTLLVSQKEVDRQAVANLRDVDVVALPAVGLTRGAELSFLRRSWQSYRASRKVFLQDPPRGVLAMGGFTSAPPVIAGKRLGARTFLHESNAIPGRANRWLSRVVDVAFAGFPAAQPRLHCRAVKVTGTPVRSQFQPRAAAECRAALGLDPSRPVVLVMGGSQGAAGVNQMVLGALPELMRQGLDWQWFHLAGPADLEPVRAAYAALAIPAQVHSFFAAMELALGAATAVVSRAGASSLAEIAAMRVPGLLVPFPAAADNHQWYNARAFSESGAALMLEQKDAARLPGMLRMLMENHAGRTRMAAALEPWHAPGSAREIASLMCEQMARRNPRKSGSPFAAHSLMEGSAG